MKKFSLISENANPNLEDLESYFDFIKDFDFNVEIKNCYLRRPTQTPRQSAKVILDSNKIPTNETQLWSKAVLVKISKNLGNFDISFDSDLSMGYITSPQFFDLSVDDLNQFFYEILNVLSQLRSYNPILGAISTGRWFIVFDYGKLSDDEISRGEEFKRVRDFIINSMNSWISANKFKRTPPENGRLNSIEGTGLKSLTRVRFEVSMHTGHIEISDSGGHGAQKIKQIEAILTGQLGANQRNIPEISNIRDQVDKWGWKIINGRNGLKLEKKQ